MKVDNPLSRDFLVRYPVEAARTLEQVSASHVAALFSELPLQLSVPVMAAMLPGKAASCLASMTDVSAAKLLADLPIASAARIYRLLSQSKQNSVSTHLSQKVHTQLQHYLDFPSTSVGALLDSVIEMLPQNVTVADAIRHIERLEHSISNEIYIIDDKHKLVGMVELGKLLTTNRNARLGDIMSRKTQPIYAHVTAQSLLLHPGWATRRRLPVIDRDDTLLGVLHYTSLLDSAGGMDTLHARDPLENLLSLASLYWLSVAQLMDSVLSITRTDRGDKS